MTRLVLATCGQRKGDGWDIIRFAYCDDLQDNAHIKDERYVRKLVERLSGACEERNPEGDTSWITDERPPADIDRFFDVKVEVENHGRDNAKYRADYHRYPGCPSKVVDDGLEIYHAIRKFGIRPAMKQVENRKRAKESAAAKEAQRARFEIGKVYYAPRIDQFGHWEHSHLVFQERHRKRVRRFDNGDEYLTVNGLVFKAKDGGEKS